MARRVQDREVVTAQRDCQAVPKGVVDPTIRVHDVPQHPVVSVQPDQVMFEAFSLDESMYGRVSLPNRELDLIEPLQRGTTNIDFSETLAKEFDRVRSYRPLTLKVGQESVEIATNIGTREEKKIDLPETWVKGFLEVQSATALATKSIKLTPATVSDLISVLENHKDNVSPISLKFLLEPNI